MTRSHRIILAVIVIVAFGVRFGYLLHALNTPGYVWEDPDRFGQLTIVDTHGSIHINAPAGQRAPGIVQTGTQLWRTFAARPGEYVLGCLARARSLLHVNGGRQLEIYVVAGNKVRAIVWKTLLHLGTDGLLVLGSICAAIGAVVVEGR